MLFRFSFCVCILVHHPNFSGFFSSLFSKVAAEGLGEGVMGAVFLSSPPSHSSPAGQRLPRNIRNLFRSPPEYFCALEPPSMSPATCAPPLFLSRCFLRASLRCTAILLFCSRLCTFLIRKQILLRLSFRPRKSLHCLPPHRMPLVLGSSGHPSSIQIPSQVPHCVGDTPFGCASAFLSLPSQHFPRQSSCPSAPFELCRPLCASPI